MKLKAYANRKEYDEQKRIEAEKKIERPPTNPKKKDSKKIYDKQNEKVNFVTVNNKIVAIAGQSYCFLFATGYGDGPIEQYHEKRTSNIYYIVSKHVKERKENYMNKMTKEERIEHYKNNIKKVQPYWDGFEFKSLKKK